MTKVTTDLLKRQGFAPQGQVRQFLLDGHGFARADFTRASDAQTVLVTMLRGYALSFVLMGPTRGDVDRMVASLDSLKFTARPAAPKSPARSTAAPPR